MYKIRGQPLAALLCFSPSETPQAGPEGVGFSQASCLSFLPVQGHFHHCRRITGLDPQVQTGARSTEAGWATIPGIPGRNQGPYSGDRRLASPPAVTSPRDSSGGFLSSCYPILTFESGLNASSWLSWACTGSSAMGLLQKVNLASPAKFW